MLYYDSEKEITNGVCLHYKDGKCIIKLKRSADSHCACYHKGECRSDGGTIVYSVPVVRRDKPNFI